KVVKNMSEQEIKNALDGYLNGKGGSMKELMMQEVNVGVDTDAMAADVYNEARTPGFEEPTEDFVFQKRFNVKTLHKLKNSIKKIKSKEDMPKIFSQIKSIAFSNYSYDSLLRDKVDIAKFKPDQSLNKKELLKRVTKIKKCVDNSFSDEEIVKCRVELLNLAGNIIKNEELKMKKMAQKKRTPIYAGEGAVDISEYLK
ncbi:MAG: hypothetical protein U9R37_04105, partial [Campylobacterota bacterium]|nr:hypothetical protein [Campylobacterota bacterium]